MDASKPLSILKQEKFAQFIFQGETYEQAFVKAGYKHDRGHASRLASSGNVKMRVAYLHQVNALRKGITVNSLCDELEKDRQLARNLEQPAAAISATMSQAKLMGLLVERKESGKPGDFNGMSVEELRKQLQADLDALEMLRAKRKDEPSH